MGFGGQTSLSMEAPLLKFLVSKTAAHLEGQVGSILGAKKGFNLALSSLALTRY